jgi:hypothetical protein
LVDLKKKSSSLKLLCQMNQNLVGSILGRSSIKIVHLHPIGAFHHVSVHLAKQLQRKRFLEIDQSETRMACGCHVY